MSRVGKPFARFVALPENRSAFLAIEQLAGSLTAPRSGQQGLTLFLHGPPGTGKTHLVSALVGEVTGHGVKAEVVGARDLFDRELAADSEAAPDSESWLNEELLVIEDVQHLPLKATESLVQLLDTRHSHGLTTVLTATAGPRHLGQGKSRWPNRLTSRLAQGLVVGLEPLSAESRCLLLQTLAQRRQLAVGQDLLAWLAEHVNGGGRQMEGIIHQLAELVRLHRQPLDLAAVADHFQDLVQASQPTVERITQEVGSYFRIEPRQLQSRGRQRNVLWPRQVGMYLARQLTSMSLDQIGAYFGGRDHSTVLHACRKVAHALEKDPALSGVVRQIHADLL